MKKLLDIIPPVGKRVTTSTLCQKVQTFRDSTALFPLHSLLQPACSGLWAVRGWGGSDAVGAAVLPPEQRDCCNKGLLLSAPAAQVLICCDVHVLGVAWKLCDLWTPALSVCTPSGRASHALVSVVRLGGGSSCDLLECAALQRPHRRRVRFSCLSSLQVCWLSVLCLRPAVNL